MGISVIELALGRFPFSEEDDKEDVSEDDDDDIPEELRGTLSPTKPDAQAAARAAGVRAKKTKKAEKPAGVSLEGTGTQMSILDLLQHIVNEPAPRLPTVAPNGRRFSNEMVQFIDLCLCKDVAKRPSPKELTEHSYVKGAEAARIDLLGWVKSLK